MCSGPKAQGSRLSPPQDGFAVANLGQRPRIVPLKNVSAESAIHFLALIRAFSALLLGELDAWGAAPGWD